MRLFADTNIAAPTVRDLRADGHDVIYSGERPADPGDEALLAEASADRRVFLTKDHDIGALVFRDRVSHSGILLVDDLGSPREETEMIRAALRDQLAAFERGLFVRASTAGSRVVIAEDGP